MRIQELAAAIFAAPEWLRVQSVTVETKGGEPTVLTPQEFEGFELPLAPFTLTVDVVPTQAGSSPGA